MADTDESSGEKTLEATQKKIDDAIERGDVAKSMELNTWFLLAGATLAIFAFAPSASESMVVTFRAFISNAGLIPGDGGGVTAAVNSLLLSVGQAIAVPLLLLVVAAAAGNMVQHRLLWTVEPLTPRLQKISPIAGFKRIFGKEAWVNFAKGLIKIVVVGGVIFYVVWPEREEMAALLASDVTMLTPYIFGLLLKLLVASVVILSFVALGDWIYQRQSWFVRQRMSQQELKEEFKQTEGNPEIKAKIKQLRRQRSAKRMMANVPKASVVITNPTHFAVALRYEQGMGAPICVAKGVDAVAFRIRSVAQEHEVAIVENPPLARALYATVEIDDEIPTEQYKAVAEVISYVMKLKSGRAWSPAR